MNVPLSEFLANDARYRAACEFADPLIIPTGRDVADRALAGEIAFRHTGVRFLHVGRSGVDWSGGHEVHQEWRAQLNRFFHLTPLASAYTETRDERYAQAAADYLRDWLTAHPSATYTLPPYDNTLNLPIRVQQWLQALPAFASSPAFDDALVQAVFASVRAQLAYLLDHLTPSGNWRIAQADALLSTGLRLSMLPESTAWRTRAVRILNDAYHRQVLPDGAHIERNPSYHTWMTRVFERYWRLGRNMPELGLAMTADVVARMHDYALGSTLPNGDGNRLHDGGGRFTGEYIDDRRRERSAFRQSAGLPDDLPPTSLFFPAAGQANLRTSWDPDATYLSFDATTWGGGHCHLSRNAIQLHAFGRSLLIDVGTLTYERSDPMLAHGKRSAAHNTLNLNGWNQSIVDPRSRFDTTDGYDLVASLYDGGYWPGEYGWAFMRGHGAGLYAEHHRTLLWVRGRFALILDHLHHTATDEAKPSLESNWQFAPGELHVDFPARRAVTAHPDANVLMLFPLLADGMAAHVYAGQADPPRGWVQGEGGYAKAPQLCLRTDRHEPWDVQLATVLAPFRGTEAPDVSAEIVPSGGPAAPSRLTLRWGSGETDTVWWTRRLGTAVGTVSETDATAAGRGAVPASVIETDASLLHLRRDAAGKLAQGVCVDATYCAPLTASVSPAPGLIRLG